jgi:hypothetical protein
MRVYACVCVCMRVYACAWGGEQGSLGGAGGDAGPSGQTVPEDIGATAAQLLLEEVRAGGAGLRG